MKCRYTHSKHAISLKQALQMLCFFAFKGAKVENQLAENKNCIKIKYFLSPASPQTSII